MRASPLRRSFILAALAVPAFLNLSCGGDSGGGGPPEPSSVVVTPGNDTLFAINSTQAYTASVLNDEGDPISGVMVTWASSDTTVITIDAATGLATARKNGQAQISAHAGELQGTALSFVAQLVTTVVVTPGNAAFTAVGDTVRFAAVAKDAGNTPVAGVQILWTVSDNTVATVDTLGLVRSKGPGTALVSAQAQTRAGYASVGVAPGVTSLVILGAPASAMAGEPMAAALQVELRDANGNRVMNASLPITVAAAEDAQFNVLHGTTTLISDQGRASFTGLWFTRTDQDRFMVTAGALPPVYSTSVAIAPASPARVTLDNSIVASYEVGDSIPLLARVRDRFGNSVTNYGGSVTAQVAEGPEGGTLFGVFSIAAPSGLATFASLNIHRAGGPWRLTAFLPGIPTVRDTTVPFTVVAGPAASVEVTHVGPIFAVAPVGQESTSVQLADMYGNPAEGVISIGLTGWSYAATPTFAPRFTTDTIINVSGGEVDLRLGVTRPGRFQLVVSSPGAIPDTTQPFIARLPLYFAGFMGTADEASCLLRTLCSGNNENGLLRIDPLALAGDSIFIPNDTGFGSGMLQMDGGARHICAAIDDPGFGSHVECWGDNSEGQLGNGTVGGHSFVPQAGEIWSVIALSAGAAHTCVSYAGLVQCWGRNDQGQLGRGTTGASSGTPTEIVNAGAHTFLRLAAGGRHTCGLDDNQHIWCWGANDFGQLGDSGVSGANSAVPVIVDSTKVYADVVAGEDFTCATVLAGPDDATLRCWGRNDKGQLGNIVADSIVRTPISMLFATGHFVAIAAGAKFACVVYVSTIGGVANECWGANDHGQLGRGTFTPFESTPQGTSAAGPYGVLTKMSAGAEYICGSSHEAQPRYVCWGRNDHGQFGSGSTNDSSTPAVIEGYY